MTTKMVTRENKADYINQISTDVTLISFLTVVPVFFIGSLISNFNSYGFYIKIPISFLIISTLGFLFAALILANTGQKLIDEKFEEAEKNLLWGYALSEYMGVYLFVTSIPLVINIITTDLYLRSITLLAGTLYMTFYQFMGFSLIKSHFSKKNKLFSFVTIVLMILLFFSQIYNSYFTVTALIFVLFIIFITALAPSKKFQ